MQCRYSIRLNFILEIIHRIKMCMQAPSKGTRPARFDMSNVLEEQKSQRTLFTEIDGLQSPITNPTFIQESDDKLDLDEER